MRHYAWHQRKTVSNTVAPALPVSKGGDNSADLAFGCAYHAREVGEGVDVLSWTLLCHDAIHVVDVSDVVDHASTEGRRAASSSRTIRGALCHTTIHARLQKGDMWKSHSKATSD